MSRIGAALIRVCDEIFTLLLTLALRILSRRLAEAWTTITSARLAWMTTVT